MPPCCISGKSTTTYRASFSEFKCSDLYNSTKCWEAGKGKHGEQQNHASQAAPFLSPALCLTVLCRHSGCTTLKSQTPSCTLEGSGRNQYRSEMSMISRTSKKAQCSLHGGNGGSPGFKAGQVRLALQRSVSISTMRGHSSRSFSDPHGQHDAGEKLAWTYPFAMLH